MMHSRRVLITLCGILPSVAALSSPLPIEFQNATAKWAYLSYENPSYAVLPGLFNRSIYSSQVESTTSNIQVLQEYVTRWTPQPPRLCQCVSPIYDATTLSSHSLEYLNSTDFVAYDQKFFDLIGPDAQIRRLHDLPFQTHEAPCYNPSANQVFFIEWGPPGGDDGTHDWQYVLDTKTNELRKIQTRPPLHNVHGCVFHDGAYYVVTDGSHNETASLNKINPDTFEVTRLLNNAYGIPFQGLNDIDVDIDGNFWITDDHYGWGRGIVEFTPPQLSTVYFVNKTTLRPRPFYVTTGQANGIALFQDEDGKDTIYISDTAAVSPDKNHTERPYYPRTLTAIDVSYPGPLTSAPRLVSVPISFVYDGVRVSQNGWVFAGAGNGLDVLDPRTGLTLGTIRVGGGNYVAVNSALGQNELWIVGSGGIWHVTGLRETLARGF